MWPKNHRRNPPSGWDVAALAATAGASPAPSGRPHPTPPGYLQWYPPLPSPGHDIRNDPQRPLPRARRYRWLDPHLVTHSKRAVFETLNLRKVDVKRYTPTAQIASSTLSPVARAADTSAPSSPDASSATLPSTSKATPIPNELASVHTVTVPCGLTCHRPLTGSSARARTNSSLANSPTELSTGSSHDPPHPSRFRKLQHGRSQPATG
ncbi:hypothetical protein GQR58_011003 [Nymphon striatum]|nr:hypothetical protein GQR58_011003 [Nymphon striatum]